jgi:parallel beta helix pectate lyase-like protein
MRDRRPDLFALILCLAAVLAACTSEAPVSPGRQPATPLQPSAPLQPSVPLQPSIPMELYERSGDGGPRPTLHVSPDGDDAAPGTRDEPLQTIGRAAELATPGSLVRVAGGTYEGSVATAATGTADAPITYLSDPKDPAEVVGTSGKGAAWRNKGDHVEIVGFTITGVSTDGLLNKGSFVRIVGNTVSDFDEGNCITTARSGYTLHDIDVIGNVVHGCGGSALDHGIYVSHPGGTVANNISYGNAGFGIHCWHNCNHLVISHNLVFDNREGGILIGQGDSPNNGEVAADNFVVSNNIAIGNGEYGIEESGATGANNRYLNNNVFDNEVGGLDLHTGQEIGTIVTSPEFVDFQPDGSGDYRLSPSSPIIDAGTTEGTIGMDFVGTPRPRGARVDLGAYEH